MKNPEWTDRLVSKVLEIEHRTKCPKVIFRKGNGSGTAFYKFKRTKTHNGVWIRKMSWSHITVRSYGNEKRDKMVLLHELAHVMGRVNTGHNLKFWERAWSYYEVFRSELDWEAVKKSEFWYMKKAKTAYEKLYPEVEPPLGQLSLAI
jgi:hypothetical protein